MNRVVFTFAVGPPEYRELARMMADRWRAINGETVTILGEDALSGMPSVHWERLRAFDLFPEADEVIAVDSDIWAVRPWEWSEHAFEWGSDEIHLHHVATEMRRFRLSRYGNGGLWRAKREWRGMLDRVAATARLLPPGTNSYGSWYEQTALNEVMLPHAGEGGRAILRERGQLQQVLYPFRDILEAYWLRDHYPGAANWHFTSMSKAPAKLVELFARLSQYE